MIRIKLNKLFPKDLKWLNQQGELHRNYDKPAYEDSLIIVWLQNGKKHRLNGPAFIDKKGDEYYYNNGIPFCPND